MHKPLRLHCGPYPGPVPCPPRCAKSGARGPTFGLVLLAATVVAACADLPSPPIAARRSALVGEETSTQATLALPADVAHSAGQVVVRGGWGSAAGQFGKRDEGSRPGPMGLAVGLAGEIFVLDQVNRRVCRFSRDGKLEGMFSVESETAEDLAVVGDTVWVLFYEPGRDHGYRLRQYRRDGALAQDAPLSRTLDLVTGLFSEGEDLWVEERHEEQLQVVARGKIVPAAQDRRALLGRPDPARPGARLLLGRDAGRAVVDRTFPGRSTSRLLTLDAPLPLVAVDDLLVDGRGGIYLSLILGTEAGPDFEMRDARRLMAVYRPGQGVRTVALASDRATDTFRPLAVGRDGALHELELTEAGVAVRRFALDAGGAR